MLKRQLEELARSEELQAQRQAAVQLANKWYYRTGEGTVEGPFMLQQMQQWWRAGYFALEVQVRLGPEGPFFTLQHAPEICGEKATPRTAAQWKERGNKCLREGDAEAAVRCYTTALDKCESRSGPARVETAPAPPPKRSKSSDKAEKMQSTATQQSTTTVSEPVLVAALLSNRSGAWLQLSKVRCEFV